MYRGAYARNLGLAYQITKDAKYSTKATEALLNMDLGDTSYNVDRANALGAFSLAYDWVQPTLTLKNDTIIRDKLATLADTVYKDLNDTGTNRNLIKFWDSTVRHIPWLELRVRFFPIVPTRTTFRSPPHRQTGTKWERITFLGMTSPTPMGVQCLVTDWINHLGRH